MVNPVYPAELPPFVELEGFEETLPFPVKRTPMDSGPVKQRREFTAAETPMQFTTDIMTTAQGVIFEAWYIETLKQGSLEWDWVHPRTQQAVTFRFTAGPKAMPLKGGRVQYRLALEIMP
ncbi:hypothetical protein [Shumkonia mesophila]|uniref:hypothetical protein n=1 Tax=Shumkonia mesophila TaxID=2838854 RepID=UPI002934C002|nr:hypothetical protein [Shumkonia mesophila]